MTRITGTVAFVESSLRERKKEATRRALYEAVLELAVAKGLDAVTVEAVADHANVSRRTFSNYFANKEEAVGYGERIRIERLLHDLRERPAAEGPWQALSSAGAGLFAALDDLDPRWLTQLRLVSQHPGVLAQQVAAQAVHEHELAAEIADRFAAGPDVGLRSRLLAAFFLVTLRTALSVWSEHPDAQPPSRAIEEALRVAAEPFR
jgi:AcrR family transcriptional regulator